MTSMVERVAQAIANRASSGLPDDTTDFYQDMARAAIAAMRVPTDEMILAVPTDEDCEPVAWSTREQYWRAMIDEALR